MKSFGVFIEAFLHGSRELFDKFKANGLGAIYFSDVEQFRGKTQAHYYARPYLYTVTIKPGNRFDPLNDKRAMEILRQALLEPRPVWDAERKIKWGIFEWPDAYRIVPLAKKDGYNRFRVYEPSVSNWSEAVTDPDLIEIISVEKV